jgi:predicted murein hydrolase (TIGR00659 family)
MGELARIWVYLAETPLLWLTATLSAYLVGVACYRLSGERPWVNPVLIAVALIALALARTDTSYATYFEGAQFVHFMLGPATVALAAPLVGNLRDMRRAALPILAGLLAGSAAAMTTAVAVATALGAGPATLLSLMPKSATTPIAMGVAERIGGIPTLTAVLVILTGIIGAVIATPLLNALGVRDRRARGLAVGVAAHGIGTARAFQIDERTGAYASLGMGLNGLAAAVLAPLVVRWMM